MTTLFFGIYVFLVLLFIFFLTRLFNRRLAVIESDILLLYEMSFRIEDKINNTPQITFSRVKDVKLPTRGTQKSAGIDLYIPNDMLETSIAPGESILIPSGLHARIPESYALIAMNKSGVCTKLSAIIGAEVIDEDYQGEIHIHLLNVGKKEITFSPGQKVVQCLLIPQLYSEIVECNFDVLYEHKTERGNGGFGSTGDK